MCYTVRMGHTIRLRRVLDELQQPLLQVAIVPTDASQPGYLHAVPLTSELADLLGAIEPPQNADTRYEWLVDDLDRVVHDVVDRVGIDRDKVDTAISERMATLGVAPVKPRLVVEPGPTCDDRQLTIAAYFDDADIAQAARDMGNDPADFADGDV